MNFTNLHIDKSYINHGDYNLVNNLICPALKLSTLYRRSVGFFSSNVISLILSSIPDFIRNKGKIQMIVSPMLSKEDIDTITLGYKTKEEMLNYTFMHNLNEELCKFCDDNLETLYELIVRGIIDFKIATLRNNIGMYHDKLGIITDKEGNHIVFYGSANSSLNGYQNNYEKVRVVKSWIADEKDSIEDEINEFDRLWNNKNEFVQVYDFMDSIKKSILQEVENRKISALNKEPIKLYDYQEKAIQSWVYNGHKGFYVMATGTGKTWTAIYSAKELYSKNKVLTVIAAPYKHLIKQWAEDVKKVFKKATIILISSENTNWYTEARQAIIQQQYEEDKQVILITTISSFYSDRFAHVINMSMKDKLLIVDEAHRFTNRNTELQKTYKYMLGLSATPVNGKNNEVGIDIVNFFGGKVFSLPIEIALEKNFLVKYNYHPIYIYATEDEEKRFNNISGQMASCFRNGTLIDKDKFLKCSKARIRLIAMAEEKSERIDDLINAVDIKDHFVVYCGDGHLFDDNADEVRHIQYVKNHIDKMGLKASQFTATEDINRRMQLVEMFNENEIDTLVAIRCLDEGINIPSIKSALILASNDDYREFVQRRGRILRKYSNKKIADIYDVVVLPSTGTPKFALIELRRFYEYARLAENKDELLEKLYNLLAEYDLKIDDIKFYTEIDEEGELDE